MPTSSDLSTSNDLVSAARAASEVAARHAVEADAAGRLPGEVATALVAAGFTEALIPLAQGGRPTSFAELTDAVATVGESCASAAWTASLYAYNGRFAAFLPPDGQLEIWTAGATTRLVSSLPPSGSAHAVAGGWVLSGRWPYTSGVNHSDWALLVGPAPGAEGPPARFFAVPRDAYQVRETWNTNGMRATASHSVVLEEVFVPETRTFLRQDAFSGRGAHSAEHRHNVPLRAVNGLTFGAPLLGAVRAAVATMVREHAERPGSEPATIDLARAEGCVEAASLLLRRAAARADAGPLDRAAVGGSARDCAYAVTLLTEAADLVIDRAGTRAQDRTHPAQRVWRDVHTAASHMALRFDGAAAFWSQTRPDHAVGVPATPRPGS